MHKIDGFGATIDNEFTDPIPATNTPGTRVTTSWLNTIQRELVAICAAGGVTLDDAIDNQVLLGINALIDAGVTSGFASWVTVANQAARLALTAVQGDGAVQTDTGHIYVLKSGGVPTVNGDWLDIGNAGAVTSVNGETGAVSLTTDNVSEGSTNKYMTTEGIQDVIGALLVDSSSLDYTYNDAGNAETVAVLPAGIDKNALGGSALSLANGGSGVTGASDAAPIFGGLINSNRVTAATSFNAGQRYFIDTTSGAISCQMNPPAVTRPSYEIIDWAGTFDTNALTLTPPTGFNFKGLAVDAAYVFSKKGSRAFITATFNASSVLEYIIFEFQEPKNAAAQMARLRLKTVNGFGSTNVIIRRFTTVIDSGGVGFTYADSATLGMTLTIDVSGIYSFQYSDCASANMYLGLSKNSSQLTTAIYSITDADALIMGLFAAPIGIVTWTGYLVAGDVIRPHTDGTAAGSNANRTRFNAQRLM